MKKVKDLSFRQIYNQLIYIEDEKLLNIMKMGYKIPSTFEETGLLLYAYIDEEDGICFNVFSLVKDEDEKLVKFNDSPMEEKLNHKIKYEDIKESKARPLELEAEIAFNYADRAVEINHEHEVSQERNKLRSNTQIDLFRHQIHPDDLECFLYNPSTNFTHAFWAKGEKMTDTSIIASILTPLPKELGFALGDMIELKLYKYKDSTRLIHVLEEEIQ